MNVIRSPSFRAHLHLLLRAVLLFALGVATGQASQSHSSRPAAQPLRPLTADLPMVWRGSLEPTQRQRWVF